MSNCIKYKLQRFKNLNFGVGLKNGHQVNTK